MGDNLVDPISLFAIQTLAAYVAGRAFDALLSPAERSRLQHLVRAGVKRTVQPIRESTGDDFANHLESLLGDSITAGAFLALGESSRVGPSLDLDAFVGALRAEGFDQETLGFPALELLTSLGRNLVDELQQEVRRDKSPLFNRTVADGLDLLLAAIIGTVAVSDLQVAIPVVSKPLLEAMNDSFIVERKTLQDHFDSFLLSQQSVLVVTGQSGVGKSVESAAALRRWSSRGWTTLAVRASELSLSDLSEAVSARLRRQIADGRNWRRVLMQPWQSLTAEDPGMIVYVDGLDAPPSQQRAAILKELNWLVQHMQTLPECPINLVISCESNAWVQLRRFLHVPAQQGQDSDDATAVLTIEDFTDQELNTALDLFGADEFRSVDRPWGKADPHVNAMREVLRRPASFGMYARLYRDHGSIDPKAATTSDLAELIAQEQLRAAASLCSWSESSLSNFAIRLSTLSMDRRNSEFRLAVQLVASDSALSGANFHLTDPTNSPIAALVERGLLALTSEPGHQQFVAFRSRDVGEHFLSIDLERSADGLSVVRAREELDRWIERAGQFPPIIFAIIAWANRIARRKSRAPLVAIIRALVENRSVITEVVVRLLSPHAAPELLQAARQSGPSSHAYDEAFEAFRPAQVGLAPLRQALEDPSPAVARLAAKALGVARDPGAVEQLEALLRHDDQLVRSAAETAIVSVGPEALPHLRGLLVNTTLSIERRQKALSAIRAIGYRTDDVENSLEKCLSESLDEHPGFWNDLLITSSSLRVPRMTRHAVAALQSAESKVARAGGTYLDTMPDPSAEQALLEASENWLSQESGVASLVLERIGTALFRLSSASARAGALELLNVARNSSDIVHPQDYVRLIRTVPRSLGRVEYATDLLRSIAEGPSSAWFWTTVGFLNESWHLDDIELFVESASALQMSGVSLSSRLVELLQRAISEEAEAPFSHTQFQLDIVGALLRCQIPDMATQLATLLPRASGTLVRHLLYVLWVFGDPAAEDALWDAFDSTAVELDGDLRTHVEILRSLSICSTERSRERLVRAIREIEIPWHEDLTDALLALVIRGVLSDDDVVGLAGDPEVSMQGRISSIRALGELESRQAAPVLRNILTERPQTRIEIQAMMALANMGDQGAVALRRTRFNEIADTWPATGIESATEEAEISASIAAIAAHCLAALGDRSTIGRIEEAVDIFPGSYFDRERLVKALALLKSQSSLNKLLLLSENRESRHIVEAAIYALGEYLPNAEAKEAIVTQLVGGSSGGLSDRGTQIAAIRTLAHKDPGVLIDYACDLLPLGHFDSSARQWLAHRVHWFADVDSIDGNQLIELVATLARDRDFWVREMLYLTFDSLPSSIQEEVVGVLNSQADAWPRACAIRLAGTTVGDDSELVSLLSDPDPLMRDAAEAALAARRDRHTFRSLIDRLGSASPTERATAFFVLETHGDEWVKWRLEDRYPDGTQTRLWVKDLAAAIDRRREKEHRKSARAGRRPFTWQQRHDGFVFG